jgi:small multidrug resistance pump
MFTAWALLLGAIGIEVAATALLPRTDSFRNPLWTGLVLLGYASSIWMLARVIDNIPVSIAYAVWSGLGTAGIVTVGVIWFGETINPLKLAMLMMIVIGVVVLNLQAAG